MEKDIKEMMQNEKEINALAASIAATTPRLGDVSALSHRVLEGASVQALHPDDRQAALDELERRKVANITEAQAEYAAKLWATSKALRQVDFEEAGRYFTALARKPAAARPDAINYDTTRRLLWMAWAAEIAATQYLDVSKNPQAALEGTNLAAIMPAVCWWLMGEPMPAEFMEANGLTRGLDPGRGIIFWGAMGCGKSALVKAMVAVTKIWATERFGWNARKLAYSNMDTEYTGIVAGGSLGAIEAMTKGHRVIDEAKLMEHGSVKHFGQDLNPLEMILFARHEEWQRNGQLTVLTTNLPPEVWEDPASYNDPRLAPRIGTRAGAGGQYQFVQVVGPDRRDQRPGYRMKFN